MNRPPLSDALFDRVAERRTDQAWLVAAWQRSRVLVVSSRMRTPLDGEHLRWGDPSVFDATEARLLGVVGDQPYFAVTAEPADAEEHWSGLRELLSMVDPVEAGLATTAVALAQWHARHGHCPLCGAQTDPIQAGWVRQCPRDESHHFPRTDPAVIMAVHDGADRILLGRSPAWPAGRFSTLAGFVEPGESLEAAVAREVFEETGVLVRDVRYVGSQPWPFPASLMLGFTARADRGEITVDGTEMAEAEWFSRAEVARAMTWDGDPTTAAAAGPDGDRPARLRAIPPSLSISRYLIDGWLAGRLS